MTYGSRGKLYDTGDVELSWPEKLFVNLLTPYYLLDVYGLRRYFTDSPSAYQCHFNRENAETPWEKMVVVWDAKVEMTKRLIRAKKKNNGALPERYVELSRKTPCGCLRLLVAYMR